MRPKCMARMQTGADPQDCIYPDCGCGIDPDKVREACAEAATEDSPAYCMGCFSRVTYADAASVIAVLQGELMQVRRAMQDAVLDLRTMLILDDTPREGLIRLTTARLEKALSTDAPPTKEA